MHTGYSLVSVLLTRTNLDMNIEKQNNRGFSLVELLVVILIIGILAAIIIPTLTGAQCNATATTTQSKLRNIQSALAQYRRDNGRYPPENEEAGSEPLYSALSQKKGRGSVYYTFDDKYLKSADDGKKVYSKFGFHEAYEIHYALPRGDDYQNMWEYDGEHPSTDELNLNEVNLWTAGCDFSPDGGKKEDIYEINNFK